MSHSAFSGAKINSDLTFKVGIKLHFETISAIFIPNKINRFFSDVGVVFEDFDFVLLTRTVVATSILTLAFSIVFSSLK